MAWARAVANGIVRARRQGRGRGRRSAGTAGRWTESCPPPTRLPAVQIPMPNIGYGSNKKTKYLTPSGMYKLTINTLEVRASRGTPRNAQCSDHIAREVRRVHRHPRTG